jgi:hypothetical protein
MAATVITSAPAQAATRPVSFTAVSAKAGPGVGEVTISWAEDGKYTKSFVLETGLSTFSPSPTSSLPTHGRNSKTFTISAEKRTVTLTAAQVASAGAPAGSANHLFYRLRAVGATGTEPRWWPYLQSVGVRPAVPATTGTRLRGGTFNVRSAKITNDDRDWLDRADDVAQTIVSRNPGVTAIQELSPGRADGGSGSTSDSTAGSVRQTNSLVNHLKTNGGSQYRLVRTTPYVKPGTTHGSQGARILYDTAKYSLQSYCPEKTGSYNYSPSCSIQMPILSTDSESRRRKAVYAEFADQASGNRFFYVSAHLDNRHSTNVTTEASYDTLRENQIKTVMGRINELNTANVPIVFGGDINTWQNTRFGYNAHDALIAAGYYDTAAATTQIKIKYPTINHFNVTLSPGGSGWGARLDAILVKGVKGASRWENVMEVTDSERPSDHNMVVSDIVLP